MKNYFLLVVILGTVMFGTAATVVAQPDTWNNSRRWSTSERNAYDSGYDMGRNDRRRSSETAAQISGNYNSNIGLYYQAGYDDGYAGRSRRYNFPVGDNGGWGGGGNSHGTATWSGRVDDRANIIIRGRNIRAEDVSGTGLQIYNQNMNGSLPNRDVSVNVKKRSGRGNASVIQQPARYNNYTAIIQVADNKRGAGDYQIDVSWGNGNGGWNGGDNDGDSGGDNGGWGNNGGNETYRSGRVTWHGRVDQKANIIIDGSNVDTQDDSGTGLSDVRSDISGYLAHRPGTVNVRRRSGRGSVIVLEQPSSQNGFRAIIQVFDPGNGAGDYEVEVSW